MVQAHGVLEADHVVVRDQSEAGRLSERGSYGVREGPVCRLDLFEATYLVEEQRLTVEDEQGGTIDHASLLLRGATALERFEPRYLVYRDYRSRGFVVRQATAGELDGWSRGASPPTTKPSALVIARGEADRATPADLQRLVAAGAANGRQVLLSIVDEESDVTYYELTEATVAGELDDPAASMAKNARATLLGDRALLRETGGLEDGGYGNAAGGQRFLSLAEAHHLVDHGLQLTDVAGQPATAADVLARAQGFHADAGQAFAAYTWLRERGLVPKTGLKFGVQYRVYQGLPGDAHAPLLVHALDALATWTHQDLARFARLAHSVRKRPILWSGGHATTLTWVRP